MSFSSFYSGQIVRPSLPDFSLKKGVFQLSDSITFGQSHIWNKIVICFPDKHS